MESKGTFHEHEVLEPCTSDSKLLKKIYIVKYKNDHSLVVKIVLTCIYFA